MSHNLTFPQKYINVSEKIPLLNLSKHIKRNVLPYFWGKVNKMAGLPKITDHIDNEDHFVIEQDGCIKMILFDDAIKTIVLGGNTICQSVLNCWDSMGEFEAFVPNQPPTFTDVYVALNNRQQNYFFTKDEFIDNYFDEEGDRLARIEIVGGNLVGVSYNGAPVYVGQSIGIEDVAKLEYDAQMVDDSYQQFVLIDVYDENNVKAN